MTRRANFPGIVSKGYVSEIFSSFQGEGLFAGRRHLFLRMAGCNLRCGYCDTPDSLVRTESCAFETIEGYERVVPNPLTATEVNALLEPLYRLRAGLHALAITGGEPMMQSDFLGELLAASPPPVPVLLETNGTYPERLPALLPFVSIISMDVKLPSNSGERPLWEEHRAFLEASRGKTVYVKVPVDDGTREAEVGEAAALVAKASPGSAFFLQPIVAPGSETMITAERLGEFYDAAVRHLTDVRVLPQAHRLLGIR